MGSLVAFVYFAFLAIFITAPLIGTFTTHFNGDYISDVFMSSRHVWWISHAIQTGQNPFYQPLLAYPDGLGGAYLWATPFEYFPAWFFALFMPLPSAMNLQLLLHITLNGWVLYLFLRYQTLNPVAAIVAGTLFAIAPALQGRIYVGHALIVLWVMILGLYALYRLKTHWRWAWGIFGAVCVGLSAGGSLTLVVFYIAPLILWFLIARAWSRQWDWLWRAIRVLVMSLPIWALLFIPLFMELPNNPEVEQAGGGHVLYSADLLSIVSPSPFHPTWNDTLDYPAKVLGANLVEGATYIGIVGGAFALIGIITSFSARAWLRLGVIAWVLSLGPLLKIFDQPIVIRMGVYETYIPLPWALFEQLPLISSTRAPARWGLLLALVVAVMAGYGMLALWGWINQLAPYIRRWRWVVVVVLILGILWDYPMFYPMPQVSAELPQALYELANRDDVRGVLNLPYNDRVLVKQALYMQVAHQHPILAGMMYRDTPVSPAKLALLQETLDPALLKSVGADVVIVQRTADDSIYMRAIAQLGAPYYEDSHIAIFNVPNVTTSPSFMTTPFTSQTTYNHLDTYLYAPQAGLTWVKMMVEPYPDSPRKLVISLNDVPIHHVTVKELTTLSLPLLFDKTGFYTLRLATEPTCATPISDINRCVGMTISLLTFGEFLSNTPPPVEFSLGIELLSARAILDDNQSVWVWTYWYLPRGLDDQTIRFIHITDSTGSLVAQNDGIMAILPNNSTWADGITVSLPSDLPSGTYTVSLGWYRYPSLDRLALVSPNPSPNGVYTVGTIEVIKDE